MPTLTLGVQPVMAQSDQISSAAPAVMSRRGSIFMVSRPANIMANITPKPRGTIRKPVWVTLRPDRFCR